MGLSREEKQELYLASLKRKFQKILEADKDPSAILATARLMNKKSYRKAFKSELKDVYMDLMKDIGGAGLASLASVLFDAVAPVSWFKRLFR